MRILRIHARNVASFAEFTLDFTTAPLHQAGLFAIVGPTGAGKSTVLDVLCMALFHEAPRLVDVKSQDASFQSVGGEFSQGRIEQLVRRGTDHCLAEVDFRMPSGEIYRAQWGYAISKRARKASEIKTLSIWEGEAFRLLCDSTLEKRAKIHQLLGMDFSQFTKTVLLAQGGFAAFLRAGQDVRSRILEDLTGETIYARISQRVQRQHAECIQGRKEIETRLSVRQESLASPEELQRMQQALPELQEQLTSMRLQESAMLERKTIGESVLRLGKARETLAERIQLGQVRVEALWKSLQECEQSYQDFEAQESLQFQQIQQAEVLDTDLARKQQEHSGLLQESTKLESQRNSIQNQDLQKERQLQNLLVQQQEEIAKQSKEEIIVPLLENWTWLRSQLLDAWKDHVAIPELKEAAKSALENREMLQAKHLVVQNSLQNQVSVPELSIVDKEWKELLLREQMDEVAKAQKELSSFLLRLIPLREKLQTLQQRVQWSAQATQDFVLHMRAQLVEEQDCPVCGSRHHPLREQIPEELKKWHQSLEQELTALLEQEQIEEKGRLRCEWQIQQCQKQQQELQRQLGVDSLPTQSRWTHICAEDLASQKAQWEDLLRQAHEREKERQELRLLDVQLQSLQEEQARREAQHLETEQRLQERLQSLRSQLGHLPWEEAWLKSGTRFVELLADRIDQCQKRQVSLRQISEKIDVLKAQREVHQQQMRDLELAQAQLKESLSQATQILLSLQSARATLLQGMPVAKARQQLQLERTKQESMRQEAKLQWTQVQTALKADQNTWDETSRQYAFAEQSLLEGNPPVPSWERWYSDLQESIQDLAVQRDQKVAALASAQKILDDATQLEKELQSDRALWEQWNDKVRWHAELNDLIGSSTGDKFRELAQQITLDLLLDGANQHLHQMAPRYSLRRRDDTLTIGVLDADFSEMLRPVHTLSGGESFVTSLSLALALSDLNAGKNELQTLFIDEGFGTLDADMLQQVMNALDRLHQQGRSVGVITHVEEMKAQIPVRIEVRKKPHQPSELVVVGADC